MGKTPVWFLFWEDPLKKWYRLPTPIFLSFPGSSYGKESICSAWDLGLIPELGRSPGGGHGNPLQYSCRENPMERGAWQATVHGVARVGHDLVTKPPPPRFLRKVFILWYFRFTSNYILWKFYLIFHGLESLSTIAGGNTIYSCSAVLSHSVVFDSSRPHGL